MNLKQYLETYRPQALLNLQSDALLEQEERDAFLAVCTARELAGSAGDALFRGEVWAALQEATAKKRLFGPIQSPRSTHYCVRRDRLLAEFAKQLFDAQPTLSLDDAGASIADEFEQSERHAATSEALLARLLERYGNFSFKYVAQSSGEKAILWIYDEETGSLTDGERARIPCRLGLRVSKVDTWFLFDVEPSTTFRRPTFFDSAGFELWRSGGRTLVVCVDAQENETGISEFVCEAFAFSSAKSMYTVRTPIEGG